MIINKIVNGFVIQQFDTTTKKFINQEFVASGDYDLETESGLYLDTDNKEVQEFLDGEYNLALLMKQPE